MNNKNVASVSGLNDVPQNITVCVAKVGTWAKIASNCVVPNSQKHNMIPSANPEIADAVGDKRLAGGGIGAVFIVPEPDQQIGRQTNAFPAEKHLQQIIGCHQMSASQR